MKQGLTLGLAPNLAPNLAPRLALLLMVAGLAACEAPMGDMTRDHGLDSKSLKDLKAGIWIDPQGCDHWIIDDGLEGYMTARLDDQGRPVCSGAGAPSTVVGPAHAGNRFRARR